MAATPPAEEGLLGVIVLGVELDVVTAAAEAWHCWQALEGLRFS